MKTEKELLLMCARIVLGDPGYSAKSVEVSPCWRTFDHFKDRKTLEVVLRSFIGEECIATHITTSNREWRSVVHRAARALARDDQTKTGARTSARVCRETT